MIKKLIYVVFVATLLWTMGMDTKPTEAKSTETFETFYRTLPKPIKNYGKETCKLFYKVGKEENVSPTVLAGIYHFQGFKYNSKLDEAELKETSVYLNFYKPEIEKKIPKVVKTKDGRIVTENEKYWLSYIWGSGNVAKAMKTGVFDLDKQPFEIDIFDRKMSVFRN
jgi:hypothetical protein